MIYGDLDNEEGSAAQPFVQNSLRIPCEFPGGRRKPAVYAGPGKEFFSAGKNSLRNSLRREFGRLALAPVSNSPSRFPSLRFLRSGGTCGRFPPFGGLSGERIQSRDRTPGCSGQRHRR